jgi:hypothetical protein
MQRTAINPWPWSLQVRAWGRHMGTSVAPRTAARQLKGDSQLNLTSSLACRGWGS